MIAHDEMMEHMRNNFDKQDEPYIGIFWFDAKEDELFGIQKHPAADTQFDCNGNKTIRVLHKDFWQKEYHKSKALNKQTRFVGDYTLTPRGRVWEKRGQGFVVTIGEWINDYPQAKELILIEFNLPRDAEFLVDQSGDKI
jgi:hypothetical protein